MGDFLNMREILELGCPYCRHVGSTNKGRKVAKNRGIAGVLLVALKKSPVFARGNRRSRNEDDSNATRVRLNNNSNATQVLGGEKSVARKRKSNSNATHGRLNDNSVREIGLQAFNSMRKWSSALQTAGNPKGFACDFSQGFCCFCASAGRECF